MESPTPHETAAPSLSIPPQANRTNGYEPPRLKVLGTVDELTMGLMDPGLPDLPGVFGTISDRRLKDHLTALEPGSVLDGVGSLASRSS